MHLSRKNNFNKAKYWKVYKNKWPIWFVKSTQLVLNFLLGYYLAYSTKAQLFIFNF